jgi:hypothetical protein
MGTPASSNSKRQESISGKTKAVTIGLALAIIGSIICSSFAKDTVTNYTGLGMLLVGIATAVLGVFGAIASTLKAQLSKETPAHLRIGKPKLMFFSVWSIGVGASLSAIGSILASAYEKSSIINEAGFGLLLGGICVFVLGFFGTMMATIQTKPLTSASSSEAKVDKPRFLFSSILSMGIGTALTVVGSIISRSYAKETLLNYTGFGVLLVGIAVLSLGISGTVVAVLKNRWALSASVAGEEEPRVVLGSIWAIGIGSMLIIIGSLVAGSYAKLSLMNYAGFGMLLAGAGVFVYGFFETARISAMGFLSRKRNKPTAKAPRLKTEEVTFRKKMMITKRIGGAWRGMVGTTAIFNLAGIMISICILFFSLWQLDLIVSGPVWWSDTNTGRGWGWAGPGPYADNYFQCFFWRTTVGQAYDSLFMLIFISFIVLFASAFFWPRHRTKSEDFSL